MLSITSVTISGNIISVHLSVDSADIDPGAGSEEYGFSLYAASDIGKTTPLALSNNNLIINSGSGIVTGVAQCGYFGTGSLFVYVVPETGADIVNTGATSANFVKGASPMAIALGAATIQLQSTEFVDSYGEKKTTRTLLDNTATGSGIATAMGHLDAITNATMRRAVFSQEAVVTGQKAAAVVALQDKVREALVLTFVAPFPGTASGNKIKQVVIPAPTANSYIILPNGGSAVDTTNADVSAVIAFYATHLQYEVRDPVTGAITYNGGFVFDPTRSALATAGDIIDGQ